ncbi:MAG TPA: response regulator transcription factor [Acidimicrobiia bacterium]|jgi:DNA-binding NarL/FixJ family response regulator
MSEACVALSGTGWHRGGVEGALRAAGFDVRDAPHGEVSDDADLESEFACATDVDLEDADLAVAVGDDLARVAWAHSRGLPCVLVRDATPGPRDLVEAVMTGADSVITAEASVDEFLLAVRTVLGGELALSARDTRSVVERLRTDLWSTRPRIELTPRQQAVLELIVSGVSVKQTARALGIAVKTVENTQSRLYRRLGVRNRAQAVAVAIAEGLVPARPESAGDRTAAGAGAGAKSPAAREG